MVNYKAYIVAKREPLNDGFITKYLNERTGFTTEISRATLFDNAVTATRNAVITECSVVLEVATTVVGVTRVIPATMQEEVISNIADYLGWEAPEDTQPDQPTPPEAA